MHPASTDVLGIYLFRGPDWPCKCILVVQDFRLPSGEPVVILTTLNDHDLTFGLYGG